MSWINFVYFIVCCDEFMINKLKIRSNIQVTRKIKYFWITQASNTT